MAVFELQGPDGKTYQVEAPDAQSAVAALGSLVSGAPGGVSTDSQAVEEFQSNMGRTLDGAIFGLRNGMSFGFMDELKGAAAVPLGGMPGGDGLMTLGNYDVPAGERYTSVRDMVRAENEQMRAASPGVFGAGDVVGATATGLAALPLAAGKTALGTGARLFGIGAVEGGLLSAGNADGGNVGAAAAKGGLLGGLLGLAAPGVVAAGRAVADPAIGMVNGAIGRASPTRAGRVIQRAFDRSGQSVDDVQQRLAQARLEGQSMYTTADALGSPGQRSLAGIARSPGQARTEITEFLNSRQGGQGRRIAGFVDEGLNAPDNVGRTANQVRDGLTTARSTQANAAYDAARSGADPVDVRSALDVIDARIGGMQGSGVAGDGIDARLSRYRDRLAADPASLPAGTNARELSDFDRVLGVKQDLGDDIGAAVRAGRNNEARELGKLQSALDEALEAASDGYRAANDGFRSASRTIDAVDEGAAMRRPGARVDDNLQRYAGMTPEQQAAARAGYSDPLLARIENSAPGVNKARALTDDGTMGELNAMARDPALLERQVSREMDMFSTRNQALGGSQTADNIADQADSGAFDVGLLANLLSGRFGAAAAQTGQKGVNVLSGRNEATQQLVARALLSSNPQAVLAPLLKAAQKDKTVARTLEGLLRNLGQQQARINGLLGGLR